MLLGQKGAGAAEAGLDFIEDQRDVVLRAERAHLGEIAFRRDFYAGLALDGLDKERHGIGRQCRCKGIDIAEGNDLEARRKRAEILAGGRVRAEPDDPHGAAVEIIGTDDDFGGILRHTLDLVAPFAHGLDGGLDGFGTAVHRQDLVRAGEACQLFVEQGQLIVAEGARGQRQL
eukprot:gene29385-biopygen24497